MATAPPNPKSLPTSVCVRVCVRVRVCCLLQVLQNQSNIPELGFLRNSRFGDKDPFMSSDEPPAYHYMCMNCLVQEVCHAPFRLPLPLAPLALFVLCVTLIRR